MKWRASLRGQLVLAMLFVFVLGLGGALILHPFEQRGAFLARAFAGLVREPYQDLSVILVFSLISLALIWAVSGWSLRGLAAASREALKIGPDNPSARLSPKGLPSEIRPLVQAMNGALDRLSDAYAAERRFVADAAHQLRTPVAVLKLRLERERGRGEPSWSSLEADLRSIERLVRDLLRMSEREGELRGLRSNFQPLNLARTAREASAALVPIAEQLARRIEVRLPDSLAVRGSPDDLQELIRNLIENALAHGRGEIRIEACAQGESAILTVSDEGPGLSELSRTAAFDRFWKSVPNSPGSGLGLPIARQIAILHGGSLSFVAGPQTAIRLELPLLRGRAEPAAAHKAR